MKQGNWPGDIVLRTLFRVSVTSEVKYATELCLVLYMYMFVCIFVLYMYTYLDYRIGLLFGKYEGLSCHELISK